MGTTNCANARGVLLACAGLATAGLWGAAAEGEPLFGMSSRHLDGRPQMVAAGDFNGDGHQDVVVVGIAEASKVYLGDGTGELTESASLGTGLGSVVVTDISGDGILDLVGNLTGGIVILVGVGDGSFEAPQVIYTAPSVTAPTVVDLNNDGASELVFGVDVLNVTLDDLVVLTRDDGGAWVTLQTFVGANAHAGISGDFNEDGFQDVVVLASVNRVDVHLNDGNGLLGAATSLTFNNGRGIESGDVDGDGHLDVVIGTTNGIYVGVLFGDGAGGFPTQTVKQVGADNIIVSAPTTPPSPSDTVTQTNGPDIAFGTLGGHPPAINLLDRTGNGVAEIYLLTGPPIDNPNALGSSLLGMTVNTERELIEQESAYVGIDANSAALVDLNKDQRVDAVVTTVFVSNPFGAPSGPHALSIYLRSEKGLQTPRRLTPKSRIRALGVADTDSDGDLDIQFLLGGSDVLQIENQDEDFGPTNPFDNPESFLFEIPNTFSPSSANNSRIYFLDRTGDGVKDLVVGGDSIFTTDRVYLGEGDGGGDFASPDSPFAGGWFQFAFADMNGDGSLENIFVTLSPGFLFVRTTDSETLESVELAPSSITRRAIDIGDLNSDDIPDVVIVGTSTVQVYFGVGDGTLSESLNLELFAANEAVALGDVTQDGLPDIVVGQFNENSSGVWVFENLGNGAFAAAVELDAESETVAVRIADLNGDLINDIAAISFRGMVSLLLAESGGGFAPTQRLKVGAGAYGLEVADVTGDGLSDLVTIGGRQHQIGLGSTFESVVLIESTAQTSIVGDIDGDGFVNGADLAALLMAWGACGEGASCAADVSGDGVVNGEDLAQLLANWS